MTELRGWIGKLKDEEYGFAIVAKTVAEAKKYTLHAIKSEGYDYADWVDIRVYVRKKADVTGLVEGYYDSDIDALKRNFFDMLFADCPRCSTEETYLRIYGNVVGCEECCGGDNIAS